MRRASLGGLGLALLAILPAAVATGHITPPVVLASDRDAVLALLGGARRFFVREVRLTAAERTAIAEAWGWTPVEDFYRFYLSRDDQERLVGAATFLTEYTVHGPVRVAVGLAGDGRVSGATVVELTEETYPWLKPVLDRHFTSDYVGRGPGMSFALGERWRQAGLDSMVRFYAEIVASLIQRAAILYDVAVRRRQGGGT
jgi:hypothetical protein